MFCKKCGSPIPEGDKFCANCGTPTGTPAMRPPLDTVQPVKPNADIRQAAGLRSDAGRSAKPAADSRRKNLTIVLGSFLGVLVLAGIVAAVWHFTAKRAGEDAEEAVAEQTELQETAEEALKTPAAGAETEEPEEVTSDTNEVVCGRILDSVPKAVCAYDFEEEANGAQAVVRNGGEQMPEEADVALQYVDGIDGKALYLDGTYGLRLDETGRLGDSYTVAFWIRADALCDWSPFIHIGYGLLDPDRRCRLWIGQKTDGTSVAPILSSEQVKDGTSFEIRPDRMAETMQLGVWYHIMFTVDGTRSGGHPNSVYGTLYVSGVKVGEGEVARDVLNADDLEIYLGINCWDELFPAAYDDVRIWDCALDESQTAALYDAYYQRVDADTDGTADTAWKDAYVEYLKKKEENESLQNYRFQLVNIDGDAVPELYIESGQMAYGAELCTYAHGAVQSQYISSLGLSYIEGENLFRDWMGHMDGYADIVYSITDGEFSVRYHGNYGAADNSNVQYDAAGEPIYEYYWNDTQVTCEEYERQLAAVYDEARAVRPYENLCSYQDIAEKIENY